MQMTPWHELIADMVRCKSLSICCLLTPHTTTYILRSSLYLFTASVFRATNATAEYSVVGQTRTQRKASSSWLKRAFLAGLAFSVRWQLIGVADREASVDEKSTGT